MNKWRTGKTILPHAAQNAEGPKTLRQARKFPESCTLKGEDSTPNSVYLLPIDKALIYLRMVFQYEGLDVFLLADAQFCRHSNQVRQ
jgi:hypothetical protein